jgi:tetratricopeptide (TPR) repeat protein
MLFATMVIVLAGAASPGPATMAFERAEEELAANHLEEAVNAYRQAIAARPKYAEAMNGLGSALFKQGKRDEAITQFKAAIEADPELKLAYFNLGYAARKTSDFETAAGAYEKYTRLDSNDPDGFYGLAESYRQLGQRTRALAAYQQFVAKETRPTEQRWVDRAKEYIASAQAAAPASATPLSAASGSALGGAAGSSAALAPFPASAKTGGAAAALRQVADGDRLMDQKKFREASFAYSDAVSSAPENVEALFKAANAHATLGYYTQAITWWSKVEQLTPDPDVQKSAEENIVRARAKIKEVSAGAAQLPARSSPAKPLDPLRSQARSAYERGVIQIGSQDYAGALVNLSDAIRLEPDLAVAYVARGSAYVGMRRYHEAVSDYQSALRLDGNLAAPLYGIGDALLAMGQTAEARQYFEKYAASSSPDARPELQRAAREKADNLR